MTYRIELEQEEDGRWLAEVMDLRGVMAYGQSQEEALANVKALALEVIAGKIRKGETGSDLSSITFVAA
jgi:predicted RNase H-like HicB family nuclease